MMDYIKNDVSKRIIINIYQH